MSDRVSSEQRWLNGRRCPICDGTATDPRGGGRRCFGYFSADGQYAHCTREEHAGNLEPHPKSGTFPHRANGPCRCGSKHGEYIPDTASKIEATYDYRDEQGELLFQVVRKVGKQFLQRRPNGQGGWIWSLGDTRRVPYRLPELLLAPVAENVFIAEGEKDVEALRARDFVATTNPGGAGKWHFIAKTAKEVLKGRHVVILPDADEPGQAHGLDVSSSLSGEASEVTVINLAGAKDVSDWFAAGHTANELIDLVELARVTPSEPANRTRSYWRFPELVDEILSRAGEGFVPHAVGGQELYRLRRGGVAILTGGPGAGKTSLAVGIAIDHATHRGPVIFVSLEMDADELGARAVGMLCEASWEDVLCGKVDRGLMADALSLPRISVLDGETAKLENLLGMVETMRAEYPDQPILLVLDYLQIVEGSEKEVRSRVAAAAQKVRRLTKQLRVTALVLSQPSRAAGKALSSGELLGMDSMTAMAESAEIERSAYITLALGSAGEERDDGSKLVDLNVGKGRFGGGDRVIPLRFNGRTGQMRMCGESRPAADVKSERQSAKAEQSNRQACLSIKALLAESIKPLSRVDIRKELGIRDRAVSDAVKDLLSDPGSDVVEVQPRTGGAYPIWLRSLATKVGRIVVEHTK